MVKPVSAFEAEVPTEKDLKTVAAQLGREPRDVSAIAHRCPCGEPDVVQTPPRLADGTPLLDWLQANPASVGTSLFA